MGCRETRVTWAIHSGEALGGFLGSYFFDCVTVRPVFESGFNIATFCYRKDAHKALVEMKEARFVTFPNARIVEVKIGIEEV